MCQKRQPLTQANASWSGNLTVLRPYAQRYIWWKTPDQALQFPYRIIVAVMDKGDWEDVVALEETLGRDVFRKALRRAHVGELRPRSWCFWYKRLYGATAIVPKQPFSRFS